MDFSLKKFVALLCLAALVFSLCGCGREVLTGDGGAGGKPSGGTQTGTEIGKTGVSDGKFSLFYNPSASMNPVVTGDINNQLVCGLIFENMVTVDNSFAVIPGVVTGWSTADGINWDFTVDTERKFSDGTAVTAGDVANSLRLAINNSRYEGRFDGWLNAIYAADDKTMKVALTRANRTFPSLLTIPVMKTNTTIGSGAYALAEDGLSLEVNAYYEGGTPVERVYLETYSDVDEFITKYEDSTVDLVINDPSTTTNLGFGSSNERRGFNTSNLVYIAFNRKSALFGDGKLAYAFSYGFDRNYMADTLLQGNALAACSPISPASELYNKYFDEKFGYDLEKCKTVLDNIGVGDLDADGVNEYLVTGIPYELNATFIVCSDSSAKVALAEKFAQEMAQFDFKITVKKLGFNEYKTALSEGDYDIACCEVRLSPNFDLSPILGDGALNYSGRKDETMQEYINDYLASGSEERQYYCDLMLNYVADTAAIIPICFEKHQIVTHRGVITGMTVNQNAPLTGFAGWSIDLS